MKTLYLLRHAKAAPELVLCSTSLRTRETLELILPALKPPPVVTFEDGLYLASATELIERLRKVRKEAGTVLVIGHNPGLHELAARLATDPGRLAEGFPTAALAALEAQGAWVELQWQKARLVLYQTPKELSRDSDLEGD